jgi:hypothetical protein
MKKKNPTVTPQKVWNFLKFHGHPNLNKNLVYRTLKRHQTTKHVSDSPRKVKKRKISDVVKSSVVKHATNTKKPKYTQI